LVFEEQITPLIIFGTADGFSAAAGRILQLQNSAAVECRIRKRLKLKIIDIKT